MTQVFLLKTSTSPWTVPADFAAYSDVQQIVSSTNINFGDLTFYQVGQTFTTPASGMSVASVILTIGANAGPTDQVNVSLYSGDLGGTLGTLLGTTGNVTLTSSITATTFTFPTPIQLPANTLYSLTVQRTGGQSGSTSYGISVYSTGTDTYSGGIAYEFNGTNWVLLYGANTSDFYFQVINQHHTLDMVAGGGNGGPGSTGTSGNGGGGGGSSSFMRLVYTSGYAGQTTIPFAVPGPNATTASGASATSVIWEHDSTAFTNSYATSAGYSGINGGAGGGGTTGGATGTPAITYQVFTTLAGANGGSAGKTTGGGGGAGAAGTNNVSSAGATPTSSGGGGGGGADGGTAGTNSASANGGAGGNNSLGTGGGATATVAATANNATAGGAGGSGGASGAVTGTYQGGNSPVASTEFDSSHGCGGGGGGCGGVTGSVATCAPTGGNGGQYGGGGGGLGYTRSTTGITNTVGVGGDGLISIIYPALAPPVTMIAPAVMGIPLALGPRGRMHSDQLASIPPVVTIALPPATGSTLTTMGVG